MFVGLLQSRSQTWKITERDLLMFCDRGFYTNSDLQEHKNVHTGARPFKCSTYSMSFPYCTDLIAYKKTHVPWWKQLGNPCQCEECGKIIAYRTFLSLHMKSHTGENHFIRGVCGKAMTSKDSLKSHSFIQVRNSSVCSVEKHSTRGAIFVPGTACTHTHTHTRTGETSVGSPSLRVLCLSSTNITSWLKSRMIVRYAAKGLSQDIS